MNGIDDDTLHDLRNLLAAEYATLEDELSEHGREEVNGTWDPSSESKGEEADPIDAADNIEELATNAPLVVQLQIRLREVESAVAKLKNNTYGLCETCGKPIEIERLKANPAARTCLADSE